MLLEIFYKFIERNKDKEIWVVTHNDGDGLTAGVLLSKVLDNLDLKYRIFIKDFSEFKILKYAKCAIIMDCPYSFCKDYINNLKDYLIIDHHPDWKNIKNNNIINSHNFIDNEYLASNFNTTSILYSMFKDLDKWIVFIGQITDLAIRSYYEPGNAVIKKYSTLFGNFKDVKEIYDNFEEFLKTKFGKIIKIVDYSRYINKHEYIFNIIRKSKTPKDLLIKDIEIKKVINEIDNFIKEHKNYIIFQDENIILFEYNKYISTLSTRLGLIYKDKIIGVLSKFNNYIKISFRYEKAYENGIHIGKILEKLAKELIGRGGGHITAGSIIFPKIYYKKFLNIISSSLPSSLI